MKLVLASTSKIKNDILNIVGIKHSKIDNTFEEYSENKDNVYQYVKDLSLGKVKSIIDKVDKGIILGVDTIVYIDNTILEKPKTIEEARHNLEISSGKTTSVITGIALINKETNEIIQDYQETKLTLNKISKEDIDYYIQNEPNIMNVSGFLVETIVSNFIKNIEGSYYNILGMPVEKIYEHILNWNIHLKDLEE